MSIRRMIARHGTPFDLYSGNVTNFHGVSNELKAATQNLSIDKFQEFTVNNKRGGISSHQHHCIWAASGKD